MRGVDSATGSDRRQIVGAEIVVGREPLEPSIEYAPGYVEIPKGRPEWTGRGSICTTCCGDPPTLVQVRPAEAQGSGDLRDAIGAQQAKRFAPQGFRYPVPFLFTPTPLREMLGYLFQRSVGIRSVLS